MRISGLVSAPECVCVADSILQTAHKSTAKSLSVGRFNDFHFLFTQSIQLVHEFADFFSVASTFRENGARCLTLIQFAVGLRRSNSEGGLDQVARRLGRVRRERLVEPDSIGRGLLPSGRSDGCSATGGAQ